VISSPYFLLLTQKKVTKKRVTWVFRDPLRARSLKKPSRSSPKLKLTICLILGRLCSSLLRLFLRDLRQVGTPRQTQRQKKASYWSVDSYCLNTVAGGATLAGAVPRSGIPTAGREAAGAVATRQRGPPGLRAKIINQCSVLIVNEQYENDLD
jgi:hypothetical protein